MNRIPKPTLEDVARLAGVSTASISRALNAPEKVSSATRDRIEAAIDELGYTPNFGGRALASNRTETVGAIIPTMANAMFASGLQAFQEALAHAGVNLLVATTGFDPEAELRQIKALVSHGADGLLLIGNDRPQTTWDFIDKRQVAHVVVWTSSARPGHCFVGFDNAAAARDVAERALSLGHRRLAMISGLTHNNDRTRARRDGVMRAVSEFGRGAVLTSVVEAEYSLDAGARAFSQIMSDGDPTVVICANDVLAAGAMVRARDIGLSVPGDISFIGFDDIGLASVLTPPLATVRVPQLAMGREAARVLLGLLSSDTDVSSVLLPTEFIARPSFGSAPGAG
jgi:LacI family transcriptional regulator